MNTQSADISIFDFHDTWDLSGPTPTLKLTNKSVGNNLAGCSFIFFAYSSTGLPFHQGDWTTPDKTGVWNQYNIPEAILQVGGHVEWSGGQFKLEGYVKDSGGNIFGPITKQVTICRPNGNKSGQKDNYGAITPDMLVLCQEAKVKVEDVTNYAYRGAEGVRDSQTIQLVYPKDSTDNAPAPFQAGVFSNIKIPIWYSSRNYQLIIETVMVYNFDGDSSVRIKYKFKQFFDVLCNIDLCPLICEVQRLEKAIQTEGCTFDDLKKLTLVNSMLQRAIVAKLQPLCGIDLQKLIEDIKDLGGFDCNCAYGDGINVMTNEEQTGFKPGDDCSLPGNLTAQIS